MLNDNKLQRINELARKKKESGLSQAEQTEQHELRQQYLHNFRRNFTSQIEGLKVVDEEGNDLTPNKVKKIQEQKGLHNRDKTNDN